MCRSDECHRWDDDFAGQPKGSDGDLKAHRAITHSYIMSNPNTFGNARLEFPDERPIICEPLFFQNLTNASKEPFSIPNIRRPTWSFSGNARAPPKMAKSLRRFLCPMCETLRSGCAEGLPAQQRLDALARLHARTSVGRYNWQYDVAGIVFVVVDRLMGRKHLCVEPLLVTCVRVSVPQREVTTC